MSKRVEFFYDFTSPTAYLAWTQLPAISNERGRSWSIARCSSAA